MVSLTMMKYFRKSAYDIPSHLRLTVFFRSVGLATTPILGLALLVLPVTILNVILSTVPFFTAILSYFFLSDRLTKCEIVAMILSFSGVVLIAYSTPDSEATGASAKQANAIQNLENPIFSDMSVYARYLFGIVVALIAAVTISLVVVSTR
jgi:drug/metabolite transporter (DMT)-like permease